MGTQRRAPARRVLAVIPIQELRRRSKRRLGQLVGSVLPNDRARCLVYHDVVSRDERDAAQMTISVSLLEEQLEVLRAGGYSVADASWCVRQLRAGRELPRSTVVLTFDDALAGAALAAPVLLARGVSATLFVTTGYADGTARPSREPLSVSALRELFASGAFVPGVHGARHIRLRGLDDATLERETVGARAAVADLFGQEPALFAYPFGSFDAWDRRTRDAVVHAGYLGAFTATYGPLEGDPYALSRCRVSWAEDVATFRTLLRGGYDWYRWVQRVQALP